MSKKQKLLRKRVEAEKLKEAEDLEEDDSKVDVKVKYSVNYLYWAVNNSDDDEEDEESEVETTVVLPLKSLRLKS